MDEKVDVLDARGEKTGRVAWKSEAHRLGLWHRCFHCWIVAPAEPSGGPYLFVQRRAAEKDTWPNKLDVTVGGHLRTGESALDGVREAEEELGLPVVADELVSLGTRRVERKIPAGLDREFQEVFLLVRSLSPGDLRLQEEEVAAVLRLRLDDVEGLYGGTKITAEEWTNETATSVHLADFVPDEDGYLLQVAHATRRFGRRTPQSPLLTRFAQELIYLPDGEPRSPHSPPDVFEGICCLVFVGILGAGLGESA